jgi:hypothetical protein
MQVMYPGDCFGLSRVTKLVAKSLDHLKNSTQHHNHKSLLNDWKTCNKVKTIDWTITRRNCVLEGCVMRSVVDKNVEKVVETFCK